MLEVPHLIVGAGPVGLTAARLLAGEGRRCLVVERRAGPQRHPAAHVVNARTLEIFSQAGFDMDAIAGVAKDPADAGHVNFVTRLSGRLIGRLPFERQGPDALAYTPTPLRNISQHLLEPILAADVAARPGCELRYRTEWLSSEQDDHGVTSHLRDVDTGDTIVVRSRYVLAADGAGSQVRKSLGIGMIGPPSLRSYVAIHFTGNLRPFIADRLGVLHFVMDPAVDGVLIAHDIDREWVFMMGYDPAEESADDYGAERCTQIVRRAIGSDDVAIDIVGVGTWQMSAQVAERMRDRRVFLLGDAAHRFPPTGGLGLNTGVADAHGLIWRLAAVDEGWADGAILDTFEIERLPVARTNCEQSTANAFKLVSLLAALGITTNPTTEGMLAALDDPSRRAAIDDAVAEQATHFDMLGLQLGYCYVKGALARDGDPPSPIDDPRRYEPGATVGCRLPHAVVDGGRSTLDLVATSRLTVLSFGAHEVWADAISMFDIPLRHVRVGIDTRAEGYDERYGIDDGALLVRPDQHIAWRSDTSAGATNLGSALAMILRGPRT